MHRYTALILLTTFLALVFAIGVNARAAALVGESRQVYAAPSLTPQLDQVKDQYRRPDTIPFPPGNAYTPGKALLGQMLFHDTRLSGTGALACVSCHNPAFSYGDGLAKSLGNGARPLDRRAPSISNSAWGKLFMWDGRAASLEEQALGPIEEPREMNQPVGHLIQILSDMPEYKMRFSTVFPHRMITSATIADAIATYERTVVSGTAAFDVWIEGDETAISDTAKHGFVLFNTKARCALCHGGWTMTDNGFHDTGLPDHDLGRGQLVPLVEKMQHAFKTPGLRNIAQRAPYMHDGSLPTLDAVVAHYNDGGVGRRSQSELITPLGLSPEERADIVAFLATLTSSVASDTIPVLPR